MIPQVNLYKPEFRPGRLLFSFNHILMVWGMAMFSCLLITWTLSNSVEEEKLSLVIVQRVEVKMNREIEKSELVLSQKTRDESLKRRNEQLRGTLTRGAELLQAVKGGESGWSNKISMADILQGLARRTLSGISLNEITIAKGPELTIVGNASRPEQVPEYLKQLGKEEVFTGMHFEYLQMRQVRETQAVEFRFASKRDSSDEPGR